MPRQAAPILVIESDSGLVQLERFLLEKEGFRVEVAGDGESGLARAKQIKPGLVITEILLPGIDGLNLCQELKKDPSTRDIPVIVFSALMVRQRCMESGADAFLLKPLDRQKFVATVRGVIQKRPVDEPPPLPRITTGCEALDRVLGGGLPADSINLIAGLPGTGKTILAQQVAFANASEETPVVYLSTLWESLEKAVRYLQRFSFFDPDLMARHIKYLDIGARVMKEGSSCIPQLILDLIKSNSPRIIIIDSFKALRSFSDSVTEYRQMLCQLSQFLSIYSCTALWVGEYTESNIETYPEFAVADGIIMLENRNIGERGFRSLRIMKLRGSDYISGEHPFRIGTGGIMLEATDDNGQATGAQIRLPAGDSQA